nr:immunoglobulin light chain junction region [Macaca mulatta]
CLQYNSDPLTV